MPKMIRLTEEIKRELQRIIDNYIVKSEGLDLMNETTLTIGIDITKEDHSHIVQSFNVDRWRN
jgi:hypothetical protein